MSERCGCEVCGTAALVGEQTLCGECADRLRAEWDAQDATAEEACGDHDELGYDPYAGGYSEDC